MELNNTTTIRGFSLIELLVVAALMIVVFGSIFTSFRYSLDLITQSRAKLSGLTLANERMEYVHSLAYDAVGTVSGIPAGAILQTSTTSLNGIEFTETILIEYIDDAADGTGASDSNGITTDYKRAKITEGWSTRGVYHELFLVSNIIPRSLETNVGGGTLRVNVFDANVQPLPGADVHIWNTTGTTSIDVTRTTDATGVALFGGAPAGAGYQISVTAPGYSTDQTYEASVSLPNPTTQPVAVRVADISTMNFFIDRLGSLAISTLLSKTSSSSDSSFATMASVASSSAVTTTGNTLVLTSTAGAYAASGMAYLTAVTPTSVVAWDTIAITASTTGNTAVKAYVYTGTSTYTLIPNSDLPSNNNGFTGTTIDISRLDPIAYPSITVQLQLTTSSSTVTPSVSTVAVNYVSSKTPAANSSFTLRGAKTIGTLADTSPVYKYNTAQTTNGSGQISLSALEWDAYTLTPSGYDIAEACPNNPVSVTPGASSTLELVLAAETTHSLRVVSQTVGGTPIGGATIELSRPGYNTIVTSSTCGQAFFSGLTSSSDYTLDVSASGYTTQSFTGVVITGDVVQTVTF
jgi:type II secretory pathway pseudopilin PulG